MVPCDFLAPVETHNPIQKGLHHEVSVFSAGIRRLVRGNLGVGMSQNYLFRVLQYVIYGDSSHLLISFV